MATLNTIEESRDWRKQINGTRFWFVAQTCGRNDEGWRKLILGLWVLESFYGVSFFPSSIEEPGVIGGAEGGRCGAMRRWWCRLVGCWDLGGKRRRWCIASWESWREEPRTWREPEPQGCQKNDKNQNFAPSKNSDSFDCIWLRSLIFTEEIQLRFWIL